MAGSGLGMKPSKAKEAKSPKTTEELLQSIPNAAIGYQKYKRELIPADKVQFQNLSQATSELKNSLTSVPAESKIAASKIIDDFRSQIETSFKQMVNGKAVKPTELKAVFNDTERRLRDELDPTAFANTKKQLDDMYNNKLKADLDSLNTRLESLKFSSFFANYNPKIQRNQWKKVLLDDDELNEIAEKSKNANADIVLGSGKELKEMTEGLYECTEGDNKGVRVMIKSDGIRPVGHYDWHTQWEFEQAWGSTMDAAISNHIGSLDINIKNTDISPTQVYWMLDLAQKKGLSVNPSEEAHKRFEDAIEKLMEYEHRHKDDRTTHTKGQDHTVAEVIALYNTMRKNQKDRESKLNTEYKAVQDKSTEENKKLVEEQQKNESKRLTEKITAIDGTLTKSNDELKRLGLPPQLIESKKAEPPQIKGIALENKDGIPRDNKEIKEEYDKKHKELLDQAVKDDGEAKEVKADQPKPALTEAQLYRDEYKKYETELSQYDAKRSADKTQYENDLGKYWEKLHAQIDNDAKSSSALNDGRKLINTEMESLKEQLNAITKSDSKDPMSGPKELTEDDKIALENLQKRLVQIQDFKNKLDTSVVKLEERKSGLQERLKDLPEIKAYTMEGDKGVKTLLSNAEASRSDYKKDLGGQKEFGKDIQTRLSAAITQAEQQQDKSKKLGS